MMTPAATETRFAFGRNWSSFVDVLPDGALEQSMDQLARMLGTADLTGAQFLDIGSGSGLSTLAALRLGASVTAFDYDADSVATTNRLLAAAGEAAVMVRQGSILDDRFVSELGTFDVVYSWGVLHHTGAMWNAIANAARLVRPTGTLAIALYNDQGWQSRMWSAVKRRYCQSSTIMRRALVAASLARLWGPTAVKDIARHANPFWSWRRYHLRGMDPWHDLIDWVGGYPFEVATPTQVHDFLRSRHFALEAEWLVDGGLGCNEFRFHRVASPA